MKAIYLMGYLMEMENLNFFKKIKLGMGHG